MTDPLHFARPLSPPGLDIPASSATVDHGVNKGKRKSACPEYAHNPPKILDLIAYPYYSNTRLYLRSGTFWEPALRGHDGSHAPVYTFLVSRGNRHVLFDLGVRTDWEALPPKVVQLVKATTEVTGCDRDIASVLDDEAENGGLRIRSSDIEAIVWSHTHFDHTGDPSRFPPTTELVVGPGVKSAFWPGYPTDPDGSVLDSDGAGRVVREVSFTAAPGTGGGPLRIGRFDAFDYFGDGSFYLLDAPGHAPGHMCGLARTTADPPTFLLMGADAGHHAGVLRPSRYLPLPRPASSSGKDGPGTVVGCGACPGDLLMRLGAWKDPHGPFFEVARGPSFSDHDAAMDTVAKVQELDAAGNVLILLAHDSSLDGRVQLFPERVNDWQSQGLRESTRWLFCKELEHAEP
ncbi:hypothetical protein VPNG_08654 [Cytospora leucostoma]|uniref:Metallo-beta-lactamase domain-containing protein n=1 Tax=Cytospora leucostoma TaxID=1230097 RepID=A0A423W3B9_9PEZI|nr:hypothetical protein VPNG_08654 [Cytospora leucostoma]